MRFTAMTPAERRAAAIGDGERLHPGYEKLVGPAASVAWAKVPFQGRDKRNTRPCSPATDRFTSPESI
jgi:monoamine oxidase